MVFVLRMLAFFLRCHFIAIISIKNNKLCIFPFNKIDCQHNLRRLIWESAEKKIMESTYYFIKGTSLLHH